MIDLPWSFWQYWGAEYCDQVPLLSDSDEDLFDFLVGFAAFEYYDDASILLFLPYYYQAATELGSPAIRMDHIADMLFASGWSLEEMLPGVPIEYDPWVMRDIAAWVESDGSELMFIYGEYDPWTGGAFTLGQARDSYIFVVPQANHGASISMFPDEFMWAMDVLERWIGPRSGPGPGPLPRPRPQPRLETLLRPVPPLLMR